MQSDRNSFCGDVVLDSFNMVYRDEDSILYQKYEPLGIFLIKILKSSNDWRKCIFKKYSK